MKRLRRFVPSPAMIVALVALLVGMGGTALAGGVLTKKQFKNQSVRGPIRYVTVDTAVPPSSTHGTRVSAACPPGTQVIGGGIGLANEQVEIVNDSHPTFSGWAGTVFNGGSTGSYTAQVTAICAAGKTAFIGFVPNT